MPSSLEGIFHDKVSHRKNIRSNLLIYNIIKYKLIDLLIVTSYK
jgi:hypothetical protein